MRNNNSICVIGAYDSLSRSYFRELKKNYSNSIFINLLDKNYHIDQLYNYKIFELKKILQLLKSKKVTDIIFLGKLIRPNLAEYKSDGVVDKHIPLLLESYKKGDDAVLKSVIDIFKKYGYRVVSPFKYCNEFKFSYDEISSVISQEDSIDIEKASNLLDALSKYDNAQSVVSIEGYIIAIEAVEGTDAMLNRAWKLRKEHNRLNSKLGFLIKKPKKNQSKLIDLPVIGPKTVKLIKKVNLKGLAIDSKNTMIYKKKEVIRLINQFRLKIYNI